MQRFGFHVPQPEVAADSTNPRGFAEPKWVVDFHNALLKRAGVQVADGRPSAWAQTARVAIDEDIRQQLREWLASEFANEDHLIIKDPRLSWFLPLWRQGALDVGASPRFVTVLRHPRPSSRASSAPTAAGRATSSARPAGSTRSCLPSARRARAEAFVRYQDLLDDWTDVTADVGDVLDLAVVRDAPAATIVQIHEFVDRSLSRSRSSWEDEIPESLRSLADHVWELVSGLVDQEADGAKFEQLEAARLAYIGLYEDGEAIAQSSITAATRVDRAKYRRARTAPVPKRYKRKIPRSWRVTVSRALARAGQGLALLWSQAGEAAARKAGASPPPLVSRGSLSESSPRRPRPRRGCRALRRPRPDRGAPEAESATGLVRSGSTTAWSSSRSLTWPPP